MFNTHKKDGQVDFAKDNLVDIIPILMGDDFLKMDDPTFTLKLEIPFSTQYIPVALESFTHINIHTLKDLKVYLKKILSKEESKRLRNFQLYYDQSKNMLRWN